MCLCPIDFNGTTHVLRFKHMLLSALLNRDGITQIFKVNHVFKYFPDFWGLVVSIAVVISSH